LDEMELLADTAGADVAGRVTQRLNKINPAYFVGKGKAEQIMRQAKELQVSVVIFDEDLSPAQTKNFQSLSENIKVIDRSALILDIFQKHAKTKEAKTQVELAHLQYLLPRLTRMWTHLERQMGGIGTRAGAGETQIEVDRRLIGTRIAKLKKELTKIEKERKTQSQRRKDQFRVALVGYTNSGKSTLMNAITGADVYIRDQLFATLDTTIRSTVIDGEHEILLSDTVGFIRKLPHHLVASFRSTLQEVLEADLILIVMDAFSQQVLEHFDTINEVLMDLGADKNTSLIVLNKIDTIDENGRIAYLKRKFPNGILISAKNHLRIDNLLESIKEIIDRGFSTADVHFSFEQAKETAEAQKGVTVLEREYDEDGVHLKIRGPIRRINQILNLV
ncbi:MAG: GTPase HflX, partial [Candidatus Marinimicrobia bacterium]|nr:GTPase HflX [Candidatus Neomarinimicrobiota bacterium]